MLRDLKAAGEKTEPITIRDTSRSHAEKLIEGYLTNHPGLHFSSEIAEELGPEFHTTPETIKHMINPGKIHRAGSGHVR